MPNLMVAIQNAVNPRELGVATATSALFRSLGGMFGVAMSGAIMTAQLQNLHYTLEASENMGMHSLIDQGIQQIAQLPLAQREVVASVYRHAISTTFLVGSLISAMAFTVVLFLPEHPLKSFSNSDQKKADGSAAR
ncbi:MAG TPA: hypothetical protein VEI57_01785 [Nitrospirota bacterium]|nr:hypothetical protein [Nitrospirota bacterium]